MCTPFAEQHGFRSAGFPDSPLVAGDPFMAMALTAKVTSTMKLGTLVNVPSLRSAPSAASALTSLNLIAPGRVFFGTGTGYTGRLAFGLPPMGAARVSRYMREVKDLMAGREVMLKHDGRETAIRMAGGRPDSQQPRQPRSCLHGRGRPVALKAAGAHADGWIGTMQYSSVMTNAPEVFETSLAAVHAAAAEQGRKFDNANTIWTTAICILEPGESAVSARALQHTGPIGMFAFHSYACNPEIAQYFPQHVRDRLDIYEKEVLSRFDVPRERLYQVVQETHLTRLRDGEAAVLTEQIIRDISLTGTAEEIAARLRRMESAGLKNVTLCFPPAVCREGILAVEEQLMPLLEPAAA